ncbi:MAG: amphi-Trp domain-containing protein [Planctomycetota bacterium]
MGKKRAFEHESLQDRESIVRYLEALTAGLREGSLKLSDEQSELELQPQGLLTLTVRASRKRNRSRLDLRVSWKDRGEGEEGGLKIEGAGGAD